MRHTALLVSAIVVSSLATTTGAQAACTGNLQKQVKCLNAAVTALQGQVASLPTKADLVALKAQLATDEATLKTMATQAYVDGKLQGLATQAYVDAKINALPKPPAPVVSLNKYKIVLHGSAPQLCLQWHTNNSGGGTVDVTDGCNGDVYNAANWDIGPNP